MSHSKLNLKRGRREEPTANKILDGKRLKVKSILAENMTVPGK